ncbi:hypothetical protein [Mucilaginibacter sp. 10I4]|uniref:hypothetical protein n=1 Tax=Mucilaginibacter sp. 10I4 TaxID=3048580 RepID=UPI002B23854B|nr:hypothetical protein [Mucilaginibacter sp. 10I4]MEB0262292.1 hypothetical protein [Mucilaginibacter sp. 10I4]
MTYGTFDRLFKLIIDNNFGSLNNYPYQGQQFVWDDTFIYSQQVNIVNTQTATNYATKASDLGNIIFTIQSNGLPVNGSQIVTPSKPPVNGDTKYDYFLVFNNDPRLSGGITFTDPYLKGKSGYAVYAQQLSQFFSVNQDVDIHYNSVVGSFTILIPNFYIVDTYYLVVYPNKYDTQIP